MGEKGSESDTIDLATLLTAEDPQTIRNLIEYIDDHAEVTALLRQACQLSNGVTATLLAIPKNPADDERAQLSQQTATLSQIIEALSARATELNPQ